MVEEVCLKVGMKTHIKTLLPLKHPDRKEYAVEIPTYVCNYSQDAEWVTKLSLVDYEAGVACGNIPCFCPKDTTGNRLVNIDPCSALILAESECEYLHSNGMMNTIHDSRRQSLKEQTSKFPFGRVVKDRK